MLGCQTAYSNLLNCDMGLCTNCPILQVGINVFLWLGSTRGALTLQNSLHPWWAFLINTVQEWHIASLVTTQIFLHVQMTCKNAFGTGITPFLYLQIDFLVLLGKFQCVLARKCFLRMCFSCWIGFASSRIWCTGLNAAFPYQLLMVLTEFGSGSRSYECTENVTTQCCCNNSGLASIIAHLLNRISWPLCPGHIHHLRWHWPARSQMSPNLDLRFLF